jgi:hypothetical protein
MRVADRNFVRAARSGLTNTGRPGPAMSLAEPAWARMLRGPSWATAPWRRCGAWPDACHRRGVRDQRDGMDARCDHRAASCHAYRDLDFRRCRDRASGSLLPAPCRAPNCPPSGVRPAARRSSCRCARRIPDPSRCISSSARGLDRAGLAMRGGSSCCRTRPAPRSSRGKSGAAPAAAAGVLSYRRRAQHRTQAGQISATGSIRTGSTTTTCLSSTPTAA